MLRRIRSLLSIAVLVWLGHAVIMYALQEHYVYFPSEHIVATPEDAGMRYQQLSIPGSDGVQLSAWFIPGSSADRAILFMHGNAGNISCCLDLYQIMRGSGRAILTFDYRGYGESSGQISEQGTYDDAAAAMQWLQQQGFADVVLVGYSLGAAIGAYTATQFPVTALVMMAPFTSIIDMGRHVYPWLPVSLLARIHYPTARFVQDYHGPLLVLHGTDDKTVPYAMGHKLYNQAPSRCKQFISLPGNHYSAFSPRKTQFVESFQQFLRTLESTDNCPASNK